MSSMGSAPKNADGHTSCAIYIRASDPRQVTEGASIEVQLERARQYAADHGLRVFKEYIDRGISAWKDVRRPQFEAMIEEALTPDPPFTLILVYDHSRFFRRVAGSDITRMKLMLNGVMVQSITQDIKDDGGWGTFAITMQAAMDEQHSRMTSVKVRDGMAASARQGFFVGGNVPYAYVLEFAEKRGSKTKNKLAIDPELARTVRLIFDLYMKGLAGC